MSMYVVEIKENQKTTVFNFDSYQERKIQKLEELSKLKTEAD